MEYNKPKRLHLTKEHRLPQSFKEVEKVLRTVKSCHQNYKTILANSRLRGHIHKKVYSMTVNVLKYYSYIQKIIEKIHLLEKEQYLRREIATVLIYELLFGNGFLPGESKVVKIIQLYEKEIFHANEILQNKVEASLIVETNIPRYVRVHTLVTTVSYVIKDLNSYGFHQVVYDDELSEEKYLDLVKNLKRGYFLIDFHFKDVLVFEHHENLVSLDLYKKGHIFLQDKSSYIPVHVLNPQPSCAVLDACAAPGMKTVHIAAKMKNKGILIACERDKNRFECLKKMLDCGSVKICKTFCKDFKLIDPSDQAYSTIEYILLDPSCSGSGMVNRMDEVTDTENSKNTDRLMKLAGFQIILLKHSLKFPAVKRVVYSTCSIHEEENEYVVHEALKAVSGTFKLIPAMPEWSHRGSENFEFGKLCLRTDPKVHLTNGFFVALFERIDCNNYAGEYKGQFCDNPSFKNQKRKSLKLKESYRKKIVEGYAEMDTKHEHIISQNMNNSRHAALLNKNNENSFENVDCEPEQNLECIVQMSKKQKKKKREKFNEYSFEADESNIETFNETSSLCSELKKKCNNLYPMNDNITHNHERNGKSEHNEYNNKKQLHKNIETMEELTDATELHKKKKKKKKKTHSKIEMPNDFAQKTHDVVSKGKCKISKLDDNDINLANEDASSQNNYPRNMSYGSSEDFIPVISSHKKKKKSKKKDLSMDYVLSHNRLKESTSLSCKINGSSNKCKTVEDIFINNEMNLKVPEELLDLTKLHKKKKEKRKHSDKEKLQSNELIQETQNIVSQQIRKISELEHDNNNLKSDLQDDSDIIFINKDNSAQSKSSMNISHGDSGVFIPVKSSHKKKKKSKKEHLNSDCCVDYYSINKLKENDLSLSCSINDSNNTCQNIGNINKEISEEAVDVTLLHKKKKKKKHKEFFVERDA